VTTAFTAVKPPATPNRDFFLLVGAADYTADFVDGGLRKESATVVRSVGQVMVKPFLVLGDPQIANSTEVAWKAVLFTASEERIADAFDADPTQFDIAFNPTTFAKFCLDWSVLHVFWFHDYLVAASGIVEATADISIPATGPSASHSERWDVTVKRKLHTDEGLWLLLNSTAGSTAEPEFACSIDVEARCLIHD